VRRSYRSSAGASSPRRGSREPDNTLLGERNVLKQLNQVGFVVVTAKIFATCEQLDVMGLLQIAAITHLHSRRIKFYLAPEPAMPTPPSPSLPAT
jgi:hypothetical protein